MIDVPNYRMYKHEGRELSLFGLTPEIVPIGIVTTWDDTLSQEANVIALHDEGEDRQGCLRNYPYGTDANGESAVILFFNYKEVAERWPDQAVKQVNDVCRRVVKRHKQPGHVLWDGKDAQFVASDGTTSIPLPAWDGTAERLEEWVGSIRPGFKLVGTFDRDYAFVRDKIAEEQRQRP